MSHAHCGLLIITWKSFTFTLWTCFLAVYLLCLILCLPSANYSTRRKSLRENGRFVCFFSSPFYRLKTAFVARALPPQNQIYEDWQWNRLRICVEIQTQSDQFISHETDNAPKLTRIWNAARNTWSWSRWFHEIHHNHNTCTHAVMHITHISLQANAKRADSAHSAHAIASFMHATNPY